MNKKEYQKEWRRKNKKRVKELHKNWKQKNKEKCIQYQRDYRTRNIDKKRNSYYILKYGITLKEYVDLAVSQQGLCAICNKPETVITKGTLRKLAVDHDHTNNKIRGLLCNNCNRAMGLLGDDIDMLNNMIKYIKKYRKVK